MKKKFSVVGCLLLMLISFTGCGSDATQSINVGDTFTLKDNYYLAVTKDDESEMNKYIEAKDSSSLNEMMIEGKVVPLSTDDEVKVEDLSGGDVDIKITSDKNNGTEGYINYEILQNLTK